MSALELGPPTVRFARRSTRGFLLGLSALRCAAILVAALVALAGVLLGAGVGLLATSPLWAGLLVATLVPLRGRAAIEWAPTLAHWGARRVAGQTTYRVRVSPPRPVGTMALPGDAAALRFYNDPASGACLVHDPHRQTLSAVLAVSHPAYVLLAPASQRERVATWGRVLASLAQSGTCALVQVLESTVPDPGLRVAAWYQEHATDAASWAGDEYRRLLAQSSFSATTHHTTITLSLDLKRAAGAIRAAGRGLRGAAAVLGVDMAVLEQGLREADLRLGGWLDEAALATRVRRAYDPGAPASDVARLATAGPVALSEHWSHLRHDSGYSTVLWISEWPRVEVAPHFLHALVFAPDVRRSLSLLARPLPTGDALRALRKEKTEAITDAHHRASLGQVADLAGAREYEDLLQRERALLNGHADVAFSGFLAVSAASEEGLRAAVALVERAAGQSGCETRVLYGRQSRGFVVAALPLGRGAF